MPGIADIEPPSSWQISLFGYDWTRQTIGQSAAMVFRLNKLGGVPLFVKTEPVSPFAELPGEIARLHWMAKLGIQAPLVLDQTEAGGNHWLLMSALAGTDLTSASTPAVEPLLTEFAKALRQLHAIPIDTCPFDRSLDVAIPLAHERLLANLVDTNDFDDERTGSSAADIFAELLATRPENEDLVVCHGDACLPNALVENSRFSGFVDCGRLGIADRYQDLALATRSIAFNFGEDALAPFLNAYGVVPSTVKMIFYRLLDEFF